MAKLFFSYSHKDAALRDELQKHLEGLRRSGAIETWHDRLIPVGDDLDRTIDQHMEEADVILLLVSSDFLASEYCYDVEVKRAMERHREGTARIIPIILRPCDWQHDTPFKGLLAAPESGKPVTKWPNMDDAFLDVAQKIRAALTTLPPSTSPPPTAEPPPAATFTPRSSNLRVQENFTEADQDRFMDEAFEFMAKFFEGSLDELAKRNPGIETTFKRLDAESFTAVIYRDGSSISSCAVRHGGATAFGKGISYSHDQRSRGNSFNELLQIEVGDHSLALRPMGMFSGMASARDQLALSSEGASELYWSMLMEPLQRK